MIKVLGHRGVNNGAFYENSSRAFDDALAIADGLETDAVRSRDGHVFLIHDTKFSGSVEYDVKRHLTPESQALLGKKRLDQVNDSTVERLDLKNQGGKIVDLCGLFNKAASYSNAVINIELKANDVAQYVVRDIQAAVDKKKIRKEQIILSSFDHEQLMQIRQLDLDLKVAPVFSREGSPSHGFRPWVKSEKEICVVPFDQAIFYNENIKLLQPDFFCVDVSVVKEDVICQMVKNFPAAKIMVFCIGEPAPADNRLLQQVLKNPAVEPYIHSVITNFPREMVDMLRRFEIPKTKLTSKKNKDQINKKG